MDSADSSQKKLPDLDPSHELPTPHDMELKPPYDMELPKPHDMQLKPHLTHRHSWLHWMPAFLGLLIGVSVGLFFFKDASENRQEINRYYTNPSQAVETENNSKDTEWMYYTNTQYRYSIQYPKGWNSIEVTQNHSTKPLPYNSRLELDGNEIQKILLEEVDNNYYAGNFQITVIKNIKSLTLEKWAEQYHVPLGADPKTNMAKFVKDTTLNGLPAKEFKVFGFDHSKSRIFAIYNNSIYQIDFDVSNPNDTEFEKHTSMYKTMLDSFKFLTDATNQSISPTITTLSPEGKFCGGIAANLPQNQCPQGYTCRLDGDYPDAGGVCVKN